MINPELVWMLPVTIRTRNGMQVFATVNDVLDFLEEDWPCGRGGKYNRAVQTCRRALNRTAPVALARDAFIDACRQVGMSKGAGGPPVVKTGTGGQHSLV